MADIFFFFVIAAEVARNCRNRTSHRRNSKAPQHVSISSKKEIGLLTSSCLTDSSESKYDASSASKHATIGPPFDGNAMQVSTMLTPTKQFDIYDLKQELAATKEQLHAMKTQFDMELSTKKNLRRKLDSMKEEVLDVSNELSSYQEQKEILTARLNEVSTELRTEQSKSRMLTNQLEDERSANSDLCTELSRLEDKLAVLSSGRHAALVECNRLRSAVEERESEIERANQYYRTMQSEMDAVRASLEEAKKKSCGAAVVQRAGAMVEAQPGVASPAGCAHFLAVVRGAGQHIISIGGGGPGEISRDGESSSAINKELFPVGKFMVNAGTETGVVEGSGSISKWTTQAGKPEIGLGLNTDAMEGHNDAEPWMSGQCIIEVKWDGANERAVETMYVEGRRCGSSSSHSVPWVSHTRSRRRGSAATSPAHPGNQTQQFHQLANPGNAICIHPSGNAHYGYCDDVDDTDDTDDTDEGSYSRNTSLVQESATPCTTAMGDVFQILANSSAIAGTLLPSLEAFHASRHNGHASEHLATIDAKSDQGAAGSIYSTDAAFPRQQQLKELSTEEVVGGVEQDDAAFPRQQQLKELSTEEVVGGVEQDDAAFPRQQQLKELSTEEVVGGVEQDDAAFPRQQH